MSCLLSGKEAIFLFPHWMKCSSPGICSAQVGREPCYLLSTASSASFSAQFCSLSQLLLLVPQVYLVIEAEKKLDEAKVVRTTVLNPWGKRNSERLQEEWAAMTTD